MASLFLHSLSIIFLLLFENPIFAKREGKDNYQSCPKENISTPTWCQDILCGSGERRMRYIHNFKAAGTYVHYILRMFCPTFSYLDDRDCVGIRDPNKIGNDFVFTFVRDPIERYLSAYFEVMKWVHPARKATGEAPPEPGSLKSIRGSKLPKLDIHKLYLEYVEKEMARTDKRYVDPHIAPQVGTLLNRGPLSVDYISNIHNVSEKLSTLMWEVLGVKIPHNQSHVRIRERESRGISLANFIVKADELDHIEISRIRNVYQADYKCFGDLLRDPQSSFSQKRSHPLPPRSSCEEEGPPCYTNYKFENRYFLSSNLPVDSRRRSFRSRPGQSRSELARSHFGAKAVVLFRNEKNESKKIETSESVFSHYWLSKPQN